MKALSVKNPYAQMIVQGIKRYEIRSRRTNFRGTVLICASKSIVEKCDVYLFGLNRFCQEGSFYEGSGYAIGTVNIVDCLPFTKNMQQYAFVECIDGLWAYKLENPRFINPFEVKGKLGFFNVDFEI